MGVRDLDAMQVLVLTIGILTAAGFSLGAIFSYAGVVNTQSSDQGQEFNATVPDKNFKDGAYDFTTREQRVLALQNDIVFVNGFYETPSQQKQLENLSSVSSEFGNRVYVSVANSSSNSDIIYKYGLTEFPAVVVVGGNQNYQGAPVKDISTQRISQEICNAFRDLGDQAGQCI